LRCSIPRSWRRKSSAAQLGLGPRHPFCERLSPEDMPRHANGAAAAGKLSASRSRDRTTQQCPRRCCRNQRQLAKPGKYATPRTGHVALIRVCGIVVDGTIQVIDGSLVDVQGAQRIEKTFSVASLDGARLGERMACNGDVGLTAVNFSATFLTVAFLAMPCRLLRRRLL
jgi:hypothetical protein